jgi:hypothetical protein
MRQTAERPGVHRQAERKEFRRRNGQHDLFGYQVQAAPAAGEKLKVESLRAALGRDQAHRMKHRDTLASQVVAQCADQASEPRGRSDPPTSMRRATEGLGMSTDQIQAAGDRETAVPDRLVAGERAETVGLGRSQPFGQSIVEARLLVEPGQVHRRELVSLRVA